MEPPTCSFLGAVCVFTGKLLSLSRRQAADRLREQGARLELYVTRRTTHLVVGMGGWPILEDGRVSHAVRRAEELNRIAATEAGKQAGEFAKVRPAAARPIEIVSEAEFAERAGLSIAPPCGPKTISFNKVCSLLKLPPETLRRWEQLSLVRSKNSQFDFQDVVSLRRLAALCNSGVRPESIHQSLSGLRRVLPNVARPLAQLEIIASHEASLLAEFGEYLIAPDGQLQWRFDEVSSVISGDSGDSEVHRAAGTILDFRDRSAETGAARTISVDRAADDFTAECWFQHAERLSAAEAWEPACIALRKALLKRTNYAEAYALLAEIELQQGNSNAAVELLRVAAHQSVTDARRWVRLGEALEECGRIEEAIEALDAAVEADPACGDAHFLLALCLEDCGRVAEAEPHWRAYLSRK